MDHDSAQSVLRRLLRSSATAALTQSITPERALRLSLARSAERSVGLMVAVGEVTEAVAPLDATLEALDPALMLIGLGTRDDLAGFAALDLQLRTALVEVQTVGVLHAADAADRPISAGDAALAVPFLDAFLSDVARTADDAAMEAWVTGITAGARIVDVRAAKMMLVDRPMRQVVLSVTLGSEGRTGQVMLVLPTPIAAGAPIKPATSTFGDQMSAAVMDASVVLQAVLPDFEMPLRDVEAFEIGGIVPLPGVSVGSVVLQGKDGVEVARARLGQAAGLRAVRVQPPQRPEMTDADMGTGGADIPPLPEIAGDFPTMPVPDDAEHAVPAMAPMETEAADGDAVEFEPQSAFED